MPKSGGGSRGGRSSAQSQSETCIKITAAASHSSSRSLDLKGGHAGSVVGRCLRVLYDEGGSGVVPYDGVVTYEEPHRLFVAFHGLDDAEATWIDNDDEWSWTATPEGGVPEQPPVTGAWRPGQPAGPVEKIFHHDYRQPEGDAQSEEQLWLLVKWKGLAHLHSQWVPRADLEEDPNNRQRALRYLKQAAAQEDGNYEATWEIEDQDGGGGKSEDEPFNADFSVVERVIGTASTAEDVPPLFLVKWRSLPYSSCTWETTRTLLHDQSSIARYRKSEMTPPALERRVHAQRTRPPRSSFRKQTQSPPFHNGHTLRSYQLEGMNWLLFSWYARRSVMLADEMGLGKTIQSVSTLNFIWQQEGIRGPFLVIAPLSTLSHWLREFEGWTDMNAIVYHGSHESRELIRSHEFYYSDSATNPATRDLLKFHALITSYEVVKQDLEKLKKIHWRYLVVDEAHRLKNKDSALAQDLRTLKIEHMHLLSGTPLQNNTTELWALLHFLDPNLFPTLDGFLEDFGTLTDSTQVEKLNEKIRPYLLRRQKGDVEKSLVPLDETIIWVEMTRFQKKCYRAVLEGNRALLVTVTSGAALPSLVNIQMELRKCCNHPYLIKGVEESHVSGMEVDSHFEMLLKASGKLVLLDKLLPKLKAEGHRVLIFSQMVRMLDMLSDFLRDRRYSHERLDGTVRGDLRQAAIDRFSKKGSETFIFLLSTRAGGLGINLTAADTCIIMDSDWNPQNDVQAMARSHRIGQTKKVKVFRLVTRNTYESEMVERANKKLGLERAMNADRAQDGLKDKDKFGPPQDRNEIDAMLKRGAHDIFINEDDDTEFKKFSEADIDEILESSSTRIRYDQQGDSSGSVFSKAAFVADDNEVDMDDPEFWTKILPEMQEKDAELAEYYLKRKSKQVKRFGMADEGEAYDFLEEGKRKNGKSLKSREDDDARRAAKRALAHVWSKTERMNCERALLSFGFGRWSRIKEAAQGGTRMRTEDEIAAFGVAFVCLCLGVAIGSVGVPPTRGNEVETEGIERAREVLAGMGCALPMLGKAQVEELEPLVTAGGAEYAERVHKLGAAFLQRLQLLKHLADAIEESDDPMASFRPPAVRGGVGRELEVPWTPRDDALLLLGIYKWGYRAYEEVRDDAELPFTCREQGEALPGFLCAAPAGADEVEEPPEPLNASDALPFGPAAERKPKGEANRGQRPPCFLQEKEFRDRVKALSEAVVEQQRLRQIRQEWEEEWEAQWEKEQRGELQARAKAFVSESRMEESGSGAVSELVRAWEVGDAMDLALGI